MMLLLPRLLWLQLYYRCSYACVPSGGSVFQNTYKDKFFISFPLILWFFILKKYPFVRAQVCVHCKMLLDVEHGCVGMCDFGWSWCYCFLNFDVVTSTAAVVVVLKKIIFIWFSVNKSERKANTKTCYTFLLTDMYAIYWSRYAYVCVSMYIFQTIYYSTGTVYI